MSKKNYMGRKIFKKTLYKSLMSGKLSEMIEIVLNDNHLNLHLREDYMEIYYDGGLIAKVNSEKSVEFNEGYFYIYMNEIPKIIAVQNEALIGNLIAHKKALIQKFKNYNYQDYFVEAKITMDKWFNVKKQPELYIQHYISLANQGGNTDYTVIDIEYKVSKDCEFPCVYIPPNLKKPKEPKFDIVAVNKIGQLCIMELKVGLGSIYGTSGLIEHWNCFQNSINLNYRPFLDEMKYMLKQKQEFGILDNNLKIANAKPKFMFIYSYDNNSIKEQNTKFDEECKNIPGNIKTIKLKKDLYQLFD